MRRRQALAQPPRPPSRQAMGHLREWSEGTASSRQVLQHCWNAVADGECTHSMVHRISALYSDRATTGGLAHKLLKLLDDGGLCSPIVSTPGDVINCMASPYRLAQTLHSRYPEKFVTMMGLDENVIGDFWRGFLGEVDHREFPGPPSLRHLEVGDPAWRRIVPIVLHEDAGPFAKGQSVNILSWSSLLGAGGEKLAQLPIASYIKEGGVSTALSPVQQGQLWTPILQDFERMLAEPIGGWRFLVVFFCKGDLEQRSVGWGLASYSAAQPCSQCCADRGGTSWTEFRSDAAWRATVLTTKAAYFARARQPLHPLMTSSFSWVYMFPPDLMHVCDCKGTASTLAGSVLLPLLYDPRLGATIEARLLTLNTSLKAYYRAHPLLSRVPTIRQSNLTNEQGWATLVGQLVKAAATRQLVPWLVEIASAYYDDPDDEYSRLVGRICRLKDSFYKQVYGAPILLSPEQRAELRRTVLRYGLTLQQLREICRLRHQLRWQIPPKAHYMQHLVDLPINCRWCQCYSEEGHVGTMTKIWCRSAQGRYRNNAQKLVLLKRLTAMFIKCEGF